MQVSTFRSVLLPMLALLTASGCQPAAETQLSAYGQALEAITGTTTVPSDDTELLTYPSRRQRRLPMPTLRIGLGDFFDLYGCRLFFLVNQRNSIMGRVMPISQRLVYEIRFLRAAQQCRVKLQQENQSEAIHRLEGIIASKRALLPALLWNATFDSPEMARAFSLAVSPIAAGENAGFTASHEALEYFLQLGERLEDTSLRIDSSTLESHYQSLQAHRYGGRLATTLALVSDHLTAATANLEGVVGHCAGHAVAPSHWRSLETALTPVRQLTNNLQRQGGQWLDTINRLIALQEIQAPLAFRDYHAAMLSRDSGLWQRFQTAVQRHRRSQHRWLGACVPAGLRQRLRF